MCNYGCFRTRLKFSFQYWDSITKEDLEFSVGTKQGNWEVKEQLLPEEDRRGTIYHDGNSEYASSMYHQSNNRNSNYGVI